MSDRLVIEHIVSTLSIKRMKIKVTIALWLYLFALIWSLNIKNKENKTTTKNSYGDY